MVGQLILTIDAILWITALLGQWLLCLLLHSHLFVVAMFASQSQDAKMQWAVAYKCRTISCVIKTYKLLKSKLQFLKSCNISKTCEIYMSLSQKRGFQVLHVCEIKRHKLQFLVRYCTSLCSSAVAIYHTSHCIAFCLLVQNILSQVYVVLAVFICSLYFWIYEK